MTIGALAGLAIGRLARWRVSRLRLPAPGLYPAFTLGVACLAYGIPTLIHGSGFLSVYIAAVMLGNGELPYATGVRRVHDALGWLSQVVMFLLLGVLVFPSRLVPVIGVGLAVALVLVFVARPLVVAICLAPFRYPLHETLYVGWVGLRGAVPIVLATIPVMNGAPGSRVLFDIVFFIIVVGSLLARGDGALGDAQVAAPIDGGRGADDDRRDGRAEGGEAASVVLHRSGARGGRRAGRRSAASAGRRDHDDRPFGNDARGIGIERGAAGRLRVRPVRARRRRGNRATVRSACVVACFIRRSQDLVWERNVLKRCAS